MKTAFKEWAAICNALASGEQILILRKGGIVEDTGAFEPEHDKFLLFPTYIHQQEEGLIEDAQGYLDEALATQPSNGDLVISHYAVCENAVSVSTMSKLNALRSFHVWSDDVVHERIHRWEMGSVYAMVLRVYELPGPITMPLKDEYAGCKSWVELDSDIDVSEAKPVIDDMAFMHRASALRHALDLA